MTEHNIGVDISKSHLDVFRLEDKTMKRFENSSTGHKDLVKWLRSVSIIRIVFEPTGPYHRSFESALSGKFPLVKVNPLQARRWCREVGRNSRTA
jgi:transposase